MGVRGLLSFINSRHEEYFIPIEISDCKVIIDGNNLRYSLYNTCPVRNTCYGGDYRKYYVHVKAYFQRLLECRIEVTVVMDGSFETAKKSTLFSRARDQARTSVSCTPVTHHKSIILPMFAKETFLQAIQDLGITIRQTLSEADSEIARLGLFNSSSSPDQCFVLSNDTDFCIFDVDVISIDSTLVANINIDNDRKVFPCRKFDRIKFLKFFKIGPEKSGLLHLMATLCGNDYAGNGGGVINKIFAQVPKVPKGSRKSMNPRHQKMFALLTWLSREDDISKALQKLLEAVPLAKRETLRQRLQSSLDIYSLEIELKETTITTFDGNIISDNFLKLYQDAHIPHWLLDVSKHRIVFLPNQVEDASRLSSHRFADQVFRKICQVMVADDLKIKGKAETIICVQMIARGNASSVTTKFEFQDGSEVKTYDDFQKLSQNERENFILQTLEIKSIDQLSLLSENKSLAIVFCSLWFWLNKSFESGESVSDMELSAILTAIAVWRIAVDGAVELAKKFHEKLYDLGRMNRDPKQNFDVSLMQNLANFQSILYHLSILNRMLRNPFPDPMPMHLWWNGTQIFNLSSGNNYKNTTELKTKLLSLDENVLNAFEHISEIVKSGCPTAGLRQSGSAGRSKNRRRNRLKVDRNDVIADNGISAESSDRVDEDFVDVNNRFAALSKS